MVFWRDYVDVLTMGEASAPFKLNRVLAKISEIIATAGVRGYKAKVAESEGGRSARKSRHRTRLWRRR